MIINLNMKTLKTTTEETKTMKLSTSDTPLKVAWFFEEREMETLKFKDHIGLTQQMEELSL